MFGEDDDSIRIPIGSGDDIEDLDEVENLGDREPWVAEGSERSEIQRLEQQLAEARDQCVRMVADMDNFRRRMQDERVRQVDMATDQILREILTVVDDLERAVHSSFGSADSVQKGVELIHDKLVRILAGLGVEAFVAAGQPFDPRLHDAVESVPTYDHDENIVVRELQKGYVRGEKVLRPARVAVTAPPRS